MSGGHEGRIGNSMMVNGMWRHGIIVLAWAAAACTDSPSASAERQGGDICTVAQAGKPLEGLPEASGVTVSRRTAGLLWSHNDSGQPLLFAVDASGSVRGRVRVPNAAVEDWEDVTAGACPSGTCLYIADIGDNERARATITVYRIPEPQPGDAQSANPEVFTAKYPDGAHDAEALFIVGDEMFIVTKAASAGVYRFPKVLSAGTPMPLQRVAELPLKQVTDADASADGQWVAVRTNDQLTFYRAADVARGAPPAAQVSLRFVKEPQGEGVTLDGKGTVYLTSEAGKGAGMLTTLRCTLPAGTNSR
jgi:hypothetical protein